MSNTDISFFAPIEATPETRQWYEREKKLWPCVSRYTTVPRIAQRMADIKASLAKRRPGQQRTKLENEMHLLFVKKMILARPKGLDDAETKIFMFLRFLWGTDMAMAETAEEKQKAREEETTLLMEVWHWFDMHMQALTAQK